MKRTLITSALPYANGPLHFGHIAGAFLPADAYSRFRRLMGDDVLYVCGSDEYGIAVALSAQMAKRDPKDHVDIFHAINQDLFKKIGIKFDHYSRTTSPIHTETVLEFFQELNKNGHIEPKVTEQLYSVEDDKFLADRYVLGTCPKCGYENARGDECPKCAASFESTDLKNPRSKLTGSPLSKKETKHWFLRFDKFKGELMEWISKKDWKPNVVAFAKHYIEDLHPRAITRDSNWGIPLPLKDSEGKVFYVWFDAPIGYISASKEWAQISGDSKAWEKYWLDQKTNYVQFIGKDNIPFHAIFFPAMVMGQDKPYKQVDELPANEFYNFEGKKFNKSTGWTIDLERFFTNFSADQIRYAIAANAPETSDSEFSWRDFQNKVNSDLVGKYGNFANRVLTFIQNRLGDEELKADDYDEVDQTFLADIERLSVDIEKAYNSFKLRHASQLVMQLATLGNVYFDQKKPWVLVKELETKPQLIATLACCLHCLKVLAMVSSPIIPTAALEIWGMLGLPKALDKINFRDEVEVINSEQMKLKKPKILFSKVEDSVIQNELDLLEKANIEPIKEKLEPLKELIAFDDFQKLDLRVGKILEAVKVPKSKKLLKLKIDIGLEERTIVSGIASNFPDPSVLEGQKAIIVANLKPAKLMGIESQGMLLSAGDTILELPKLESSSLGATVR
ncbi:MAG: methionine--tRNA ligase [Rhabdochlamydiaceae bacterium]|nr:methionine--tRNA ligase [Candidatus Amphrikana amoebophyrae]